MFKFTTVLIFSTNWFLFGRKKIQYALPSAADANSIVNRLPGYADDMAFIKEHTFSDWIVEIVVIKKPSVNIKHIKRVDHILRFEKLQQTSPKC